MKINEKCFIVTGGLNGLSRSIVEELLNNGAKVVILDKVNSPNDKILKNTKILYINCTYLRNYKYKKLWKSGKSFKNIYA